jgi:hypothetical protein
MAIDIKGIHTQCISLPPYHILLFPMPPVSPNHLYLKFETGIFPPNMLIFATMVKIGLVSDTHGSLDDKLLDFFKEVDEIWHAGDIGSMEVIKTLSERKKLRAVFGNIDDSHIRNLLPEHERFIIDGLDVWITHIGGYPGRYDKKVKALIYSNPPKLFISGHSHILKVMFDDRLNCLHINPGAYGKSGMHVVRTAVRFEIDAGNIKNLEVLEVKK